MRVKKYVLDANIWISYFISNQQESLAEILFQNELTVFYCDELITEIKRVLTYQHLQKFNLDTKAVIDFIKMSGISFSLIYPIKEYIPGDADDNYILALALQTNSGYVTSGDKHILSQKEVLEKKHSKLKIITKSEFEKRFSVD